jgi:hypothetical protein
MIDHVRGMVRDAFSFEDPAADDGDYALSLKGVTMILPPTANGVLGQEFAQVGTMEFWRPKEEELGIRKTGWRHCAGRHELDQLAVYRRHVTPRSLFLPSCLQWSLSQRNRPINRRPGPAGWSILRCAA